MTNYAPDTIRQHFYNWVLERMDSKVPKNICDIGSARSGFAAYLCSLGHNVTAIERHPILAKEQEKWKETFNCQLNIQQIDFLFVHNKFDIILSSYAIQHNPLNVATKCYKHCADLLKTTGEIFISHEYNHTTTWNHLDRGPEGALYGVNENELKYTILKPILSVVSTCVVVKEFIKWSPSENNWWDHKPPEFCAPEEAKAVYIHVRAK